VNDALCRLLGHARPRLLTLALPDVLHPDERTAAMDGYRRLVAGELARVQATRRYLRADGSVLPVTVSASSCAPPAARRPAR
jgi:PAS domain S-box-containing protein